MLKNYIDKIESSITKDTENKVETLIQIISKAIHNHNNIFLYAVMVVVLLIQSILQMILLI